MCLRAAADPFTKRFDVRREVARDEARREGAREARRFADFDRLGDERRRRPREVRDPVNASLLAGVICRNPAIPPGGMRADAMSYWLHDG